MIARRSHCAAFGSFGADDERGYAVTANGGDDDRVGAVARRIRLALVLVIGHDDGAATRVPRSALNRGDKVLEVGVALCDGPVVRVVGQVWSDPHEVGWTGAIERADHLGIARRSRGQPGLGACA